MTRRRNKHRGGVDRSARPGYLRKGDTVWVWDVLENAYVVVGPSVEEDTDVCIAEACKPDARLGKLEPDQLPKNLREDLYDNS